jgi:hypothetical protein
MNLRGIVAGYTGAVNPQVRGLVSVATSSAVIKSDGARVATYAPAVESMMQVQALTTKAIAHVDALNVAGSTHSIYITGRLQGLIRAENVGGDLIQLLDGNYKGRTFYVEAVLEDWPDWTHVAASMQNDT